MYRESSWSYCTCIAIRTKRSEARQLHQPAYKLSCGASRITKNNNSKKLWLMCHLNKQKHLDPSSIGELYRYCKSIHTCYRCIDWALNGYEIIALFKMLDVCFKSFGPKCFIKYTSITEPNRRKICMGKYFYLLNLLFEFLTYASYFEI